MGDPLTVHQAYLAGREDMKLAFEGAQDCVDTGSVPVSSHQEVFLQMQANRLQDRIDRGELPALPEKAS